EHVAAAGHASHAAHESSAVMTIPLIVLAFLATVAGFFGGPFSAYVSGEEFAGPNLGLALVTTVLALLGVGLGWLSYGRGAFAREPLTALGPLYTLFARK